MVTINSAGFFTNRPMIGDEYLNPEGERQIIAATWPGGAVFEGGPGVSAYDLVTKYTPICSECGTAHEPGYPHVLTRKFDEHMRRFHGRAATVEDTYSHCQGLMHEAAAIATRRAS